VDNLYELQPLTRFSSRADNYARFRPDYPDEAISAILNGFDDPRELVVADVGAGTGISSRTLATRGCRVIAVEPNEAMRAAAEPHPLVDFVDGSAEKISLADEFVDLVTCFQAFHWFRPDAALPEFSRILKTKGRLAVVWNERDEDDLFTREYGDIVRRFATSPSVERRNETFDSRVAARWFSGFSDATFRYEQRLDRDGLLGRARSASYLPSEGPDFVAMVTALDALVERWRDRSGTVTIVYGTEVHLATKR
jgi:SAM-dependent methyltransferase